MALAAAVKLVDISRRRKKVRVLVTPSGSYAVGGDTLDLTAVSNPNFQSGASFGSLPTDFEPVNAPAGFSTEYVPGTTLANGKLKFFNGSAEVAAGAYPAALIADPAELEFSGPIWGF